MFYQCWFNDSWRISFHCSIQFEWCSSSISSNWLWPVLKVNVNRVIRLLITIYLKRGVVIHLCSVGFFRLGSSFDQFIKVNRVVFVIFVHWICVSPFHSLYKPRFRKRLFIIASIQIMLVNFSFRKKFRRCLNHSSLIFAKHILSLNSPQMAHVTSNHSQSFMFDFLHLWFLYSLSGMKVVYPIFCVEKINHFPSRNSKHLI